MIIEVLKKLSDKFGCNLIDHTYEIFRVECVNFTNEYTYTNMLILEGLLTKNNIKLKIHITRKYN